MWGWSETDLATNNSWVGQNFFVKEKAGTRLDLSNILSMWCSVKWNAHSVVPAMLGQLGHFGCLKVDEMVERKENSGFWVSQLGHISQWHDRRNSTCQSIKWPHITSPHPPVWLQMRIPAAIKNLKISSNNRWGIHDSEENGSQVNKTWLLFQLHSYTVVYKQQLDYRKHERR